MVPPVGWSMALTNTSIPCGHHLHRDIHSLDQLNVRQIILLYVERNGVVRQITSHMTKINSSNFCFLTRQGHSNESEIVKGLNENISTSQEIPDIIHF